MFRGLGSNNERSVFGSFAALVAERAGAEGNLVSTRKQSRPSDEVGNLRVLFRCVDASE